MSDHAVNQASGPLTDQEIKDGLSLEEKEEIYAKALRRARNRMAFYIHAVIYVFVILLLAVINFLTTPNTLWVIWPFGGWGLGLFFHWAYVAKSIRLPGMFKGIYDNLKTEEIARELEKRNQSNTED
jgi:hypothetical protein